MNSNINFTALGAFGLCMVCCLLFSAPAFTDEEKPYRFGPGIPRLGIGVGIPENIKPPTDKSMIADASLGFRIIGRRSRFTPGPSTVFSHGWRITPEIGYLFKRDTVDSQKQYLRVFSSGFSWTYIFRRTKVIGIGTHSSFLIGKYDGISAKGMRNGIHFGLWDILVVDLSHIWTRPENSENMHAINIGLNIDVLNTVLFLFALPFSRAIQV